MWVGRFTGFGRLHHFYVSHARHPIHVAHQVNLNQEETKEQKQPKKKTAKQMRIKEDVLAHGRVCEWLT